MSCENIPHKRTDDNFVIRKPIKTLKPGSIVASCSHGKYIYFIEGYSRSLNRYHQGNIEFIMTLSRTYSAYRIFAFSNTITIIFDNKSIHTYDIKLKVLTKTASINLKNIVYHGSIFLDYYLLIVTMDQNIYLYGGPGNYQEHTLNLADNLAKVTCLETYGDSIIMGHSNGNIAMVDHANVLKMQFDIDRYLIFHRGSISMLKIHESFLYSADERMSESTICKWNKNGERLETWQIYFTVRFIAFFGEDIYLGNKGRFIRCNSKFELVDCSKVRVRESFRLETEVVSMREGEIDVIDSIDGWSKKNHKIYPIKKRRMIREMFLLSRGNKQNKLRTLPQELLLIVSAFIVQ
jgi:hypothetical protein